MSNKYQLYVISHSHWDREWYQTFQGFRKRLIFLMDELILHMEKDLGYKYFHMDGQTIVLEDYLAIRPENKDRLEKLIGEGRIIIGPWYVMPDEFLVSGESLVRNIQKGFEICSDYGVKPMKCGYVVDIFGHNSQFPQILKGFGIDSAVLYRGIGDYPKDAFRWTGADGSSVLCIKLDRDRSYSNFYFAVRWPFDGRDYEREELVSRMKELLKLSSGLAVSGNLLMMDGVDHIEMEPQLANILAVLNAGIEGFEIRHSTLEEFVQAQSSSADGLDEIRGELYNVGKEGVNNQVLKNVLSSMVHIKQMNNECETILTKWAEPFDAAVNLVCPQNMGGFLKEAWKQLLQNHPHDSICGCSITQVHLDNEYRFNQSHAIAEEVLKHDMDILISKINTAQTAKPFSVVLFNAGQKDFEGVVEADIEFPSGSQGNFKLFDGSGTGIPYQLLEVKKNTVKSTFKYRRLPEFPKADIYRVAFNAAIPAVGYSVYWYEEYNNIGPERGDYSFREFHAPTRYTGTMQTGDRSWENEFIKVMFTCGGALNIVNKLTGKEYKDILVFEDCGDTGDGWNYRKPLKDARYLSYSCKYDFSVENDGPMVTCWKTTHVLNLPAAMKADAMERSADTREFRITTLIKMKKGSSRLEFKTYVDNNVFEHRLRVLFPTSINAGKFYSSTPFYLQGRDVIKPDRSSYLEIETGVFPNQGIVMLEDGQNSLALYNKGLYEVEVTEDESRTIALTLFRSFRNEVGRDEGEMSFMKRSMAFEYALEFGQRVSNPGDIMVSGEAWRSGVRTVCTDSHSGSLGVNASFLRVDIPGVVLSALKTGRDGMTVVRLYNCTDTDTEGEIAFYTGLRKVLLLDMNEGIIGEAGFEGNVIPLQLGAAKIITLGLII